MRTDHSLWVLAFVAGAFAGCTYNVDDLRAGHPNPRDAGADLPSSGGDDLLGKEDLTPAEDLPNAGDLARAGEPGIRDADAEPDSLSTPVADANYTPKDDADDDEPGRLRDVRADRPDGPVDAGVGDLPDSGLARETPGNEIGISVSPDVVTPIDGVREAGAGDGRVDNAGSDLQVTESGSVEVGSPTG